MPTGQFDAPQPSKLIAAMQSLANKAPQTAVNRLYAGVPQHYIGTYQGPEVADANLSIVQLAGGAIVRFVPKSTSTTLTPGDTVKLEKSSAMMLHITGKLVGNFTLASQVGGNVANPSAPTNYAHGTTTTTSCPVTWTAAVDHFGSGLKYNIYLNGTYRQTTATGATSATITGLTAGKSYTSYITATDGAGNSSGASSTISFTTGATPPPAGGTTVTRTYNSSGSWSYSYNGHDELDHWHDGHAYQGSDQAGGYQQHGLIFFPSAQIRADMAGNTPVQIKFSVTYAHWWYNSGGESCIGTHNYDTVPDPISPSRYNSTRWTVNSVAGKRFTLTMGQSVADEFQSGVSKGIHIGRGSFDPKHYGYCYGIGSYTPQLTITWTT